MIPMGDWASQDASRVGLMDMAWGICKIDSLPPYILIREEKERAKAGTVTVRRPYRSVGADGISLQAQCERFFSAVDVKIDESILHACVRSVVSDFQPSELLSAESLDMAVDNFEGKTNLGYPCFTSDRRYLPLMTSESAYLLETFDREFLLEHTPLLWTRTQNQGFQKAAKTRAIFQCSRVVGNLEKMIQIPLHKHLRTFPTFCAWVSRSAVDNTITAMMEKHGWYLSLDFANFDATVHPVLIDACFQTLRAWFKGCGQLLDLLQYGFNEVGLITPDGLGVGRRTGGIPSGSVLTSVLGSLANIIAMRYAAMKTGHAIRRCVVLGDDCVCVFKTKPDVSVLAKVLLTDLGMVLSVDKSFLSTEEIHFLQMLHHKSYAPNGINVGVRSLIRVWGKMMSLSGHVKWAKELHSLRWRQQMADCKTHPSFSHLLECYAQVDKYWDISGAQLIELAGGIQYVREKLNRSEGEKSLVELTSDVVERGLKAL